MPKSECELVEETTQTMEMGKCVPWLETWKWDLESLLHTQYKTVVGMDSTYLSKEGYEHFWASLYPEN